MNKYRPKKLIEGFKISPEFKGMMMIALPEKKLLEPVNVFFGSDVMKVDKGKKPLHKIEFEDKYRAGEKYKLCYFEWKPDKQEQLF